MRDLCGTCSTSWRVPSAAGVLGLLETADTHVGGGKHIKHLQHEGTTTVEELEESTDGKLHVTVKLTAMYSVSPICAPLISARFVRQRHASAITHR